MNVWRRNLFFEWALFPFENLIADLDQFLEEFFYIDVGLILLSPFPTPEAKPASILLSYSFSCSWFGLRMVSIAIPGDLRIRNFL